MGEEIKVLFIFEMLGRPAKHIKKTLEYFIDGASADAKT